VAPDGADAVIDGALLDHLAFPAVRDGGRVATVRGFQGTQERGTTCHPVLVRSYAREQAKLDQLRRQAEDGQITLRVAATLPAIRPRRRTAGSRPAGSGAGWSWSSDRRRPVPHLPGTSTPERC